MNGGALSCDVSERSDTAERYLLDQLTEGEREDFERHYFACESCLARVQTSLALQAGLQLQPPSLPTVAPAAGSFWKWVPAFAVVLMVVGLGIWWSRAPQRRSSSVASSPSGSRSGPASPALPSAPVSSIEQLARFEPPPYVAVTLRGPDDEAREEFRRAMQRYAERDYGGAIPGLRAATLASPGTPAYGFYLGACYLLTHQVDSAVDALGKTVSLGDSPYLESAHFLLAKAHLAERRVPAAKEELQSTIRLRGSKESDAREILGQLQR
jgi:hypothetical protein